MEELDADQVELTYIEKDKNRKPILDEDGKPKVHVAERDIVQLVKYLDFQDLGMRELAFEVLGEVPD